jgi:hypothetical protein
MIHCGAKILPSPIIFKPVKPARDLYTTNGNSLIEIPLVPLSILGYRHLICNWLSNIGLCILMDMPVNLKSQGQTACDL